MADEKKPKLVKIPCERCGGQPRNHEAIREIEENWVDQENGEQGGHTYQICKCRRCDTVRFRQEDWDTYSCDLATGEPGVSVEVYPRSVSSDKHAIDTSDIPKTVSHLRRDSQRV
jgi:hypothetical protein